MVSATEDDLSPVLIKTHSLPKDLPKPNAPALVIIRDGRPAITSYTRFITEVNGRATSVDEVINGWPSNWSQHVDTWLDHDGPKLVVRYEDLKVAKQETVDAIAAFIGMPRIGPFISRVEDLRAVRPAHFRMTCNAPGIDEIERDHAEAFWSKHGATMSRLGYVR